MRSLRTLKDFAIPSDYNCNKPEGKISNHNRKKYPSLLCSISAEVTKCLQLVLTIRMLDMLDDDPYAYQRDKNHYYPFHDESEWELGKFLVENLTQTQMIKFLKLKWFNTHARLSFNMKDQLLDWMDSLPCFTEWKVSRMEFSGYKMVHPIDLIWRDVLEVVKQLFSDPIFTDHMTYTLHIISVGNKREYRDYMSADMA
ncbi:hypothetical protein DFJ58DRAFT_835536 [Suillus subalutaceus]|uniref:uncharacterized protein n=1 Tax=Suillus subalutaceus TaxID=48586 RepID=UPI001B8826BD|nr:uncharacterized protein DFJ58DRAFT_835536 [Suillus subalutaceus]KAG1877843.1 hypothetical protein DFJ58DRAFT_835536 [Suillus subalutaceus]